MPYDRNSIDEAKKKGLFDDKTFDPRALELEDAEKKRMQKDLNKVQQDYSQEKKQEQGQARREERKSRSVIDVQLNLLERIIMFILSILGLQTTDNYKISKIIKHIVRELARIKPPIYNNSNKRVTKFFAYKIHDLYLRLVSIKKLFDMTMDDEALWENPATSKTGVEHLFEKLAQINSDEVDQKFCEEGIEKTISNFENNRAAADAIERSLFAYIYNIDKNVIETVNKIYTNLVYFKKLVEFDFMVLFRRFDAHFTVGLSPNFIDIPGDAVVTYLKDLEEAILQIDISMDNIVLFRMLEAVSRKMHGGIIVPGGPIGDDNPESATLAPEEPVNRDVQEAKMENDAILLFEILKDLLYKKYLTLLVQVIKSDPLYTPSIVHTRYDFHKIYCDTIEKRVKLVVKKIVKEKKLKRIDSLMRKIFPDIRWVGIYTASLSEKLEQNNYLGFIYCYQIAIINTFLLNYYEEMIKTVLNIVLLNGMFMEQHFKKTVSETFYSMDKYAQEFNEFSVEIQPEGTSGKRFLNILTKKEANPTEQKKVVERSAVAINGKAGDLYDKFYSFFTAMLDIVNKVYYDIDAKPPKNIRNIRAIGGFKNVKFLNYVEKSFQLLNGVKELIVLLKE